MESIEAVLDLDKLRADRLLEEQAAAPSLWDDPDEAQKITSKLSHLQAEVRKAEALRGRIDDLSVHFEMAEEEDDPDTRAEAESELVAVKKALDEMEVRTLLSGEYDSREAVVTIRAEAGGVDASDFAEKLQRMYLRSARAPRIQDRALRDLVRGRGGHQVHHLRRPRPVRVRNALRGAGHPPPRAHLAVRQPGAPPDVLRGCRDPARRRADRSHRDRRVRAARRRVPVVRPRRPGRQHHRFRGAPRAPPPESSSPARTSGRRSRTRRAR